MRDSTPGAGSIVRDSPPGAGCIVRDSPPGVGCIVRDSTLMSWGAGFTLRDSILMLSWWQGLH